MTRISTSESRRQVDWHPLLSGHHFVVDSSLICPRCWTVSKDSQALRLTQCLIDHLNTQPHSGAVFLFTEFQVQVIIKPNPWLNMKFFFTLLAARLAILTSHATAWDSWHHGPENDAETQLRYPFRSEPHQQYPYGRKDTESGGYHCVSHRPNEPDASEHGAYRPPPFGKRATDTYCSMTSQLQIAKVMVSPTKRELQAYYPISIL